MLKELKELQDFILKFLADVKLIFSIPVIKTGKSNAYITRNNNCLKKAKFVSIQMGTAQWF